MTQQGTLIKAVERERVRLQSTSSPGMRMWLISFSFARTTVLKKTEHAICSTLYGFPTFLWSELRLMENGPWCALMSVLVFLSAGEINSRNYTLVMKKKAADAKLSKLSGFGIKLSILKSKQELLTCFTRTTATQSQTSKTSALLRARIFARRSSSTLIRMKLQFVILPRLVFRSLQATRRESSITKVFTVWQKESLKIWTELLTGTTTR